jgi:hypothetical protein
MGQPTCTRYAEEPKRRQELLEGLVLKFWPLLHSNAVPETPVAGNGAAARHRMRVVKVRLYTFNFLLSSVAERVLFN